MPIKTGIKEEGTCERTLLVSSQGTHTEESDRVKGWHDLAKDRPGTGPGFLVGLSPKWICMYVFCRIHSFSYSLDKLTFKLKISSLETWPQ